MAFTRGRLQLELLPIDYLIVGSTDAECVLNPRCHLLGGFTPIYCDFMAIFVARQTEREPNVRRWFGWMAARGPSLRDGGPEVWLPLPACSVSLSNLIGSEVSPTSVWDRWVPPAAFIQISF